MTDTAALVPASDGDVVVIRSEERLMPSVQTVPVRRAVVRKRIVTTEQTVVVPVRHEEFTIEYEDLDDGAATGDPGVEVPFAGPRTIQFTLSEEVIDVRTVVRPVERVRVVVDRVVEHRDFTAEVRGERIEIDGEDIGTAVPGRHRG